ncbi:SDR family oxidoreductase [Trujillonella endophytica]|uniref:SDR family oxidoreductase n=1 Tax=Trujillonella endophytica TaxID=673521 RepID=UPI000B82B2F3|nr:NAD(P)H-binding protein [Trujillella endophytica]
MDLLVTGASGRLGPSLVQALHRDGDRLRQLSRRGTGPDAVRGDLATGADLPAALAGAEVVVHAASDPRNAWAVDVAGTRRLVQSVDRGRLQHLVYVSIVGVDRIPWSYYRAKYATEQVLLASGLPVTIVRVTQFHGFVDELLATARKGPVLPVPMGWRVQPVDVADAARYLAGVARQAPSGAIVDFGGPEELAVADLARMWAAAREPGAHVVSTPFPGRLSSALRDGAALPIGGERGQRSYADHLAA